VGREPGMPGSGIAEDIKVFAVIEAEYRLFSNRSCTPKLKRARKKLYFWAQPPPSPGRYIFLPSCPYLILRRTPLKNRSLISCVVVHRNSHDGIYLDDEYIGISFVF